MPLPFVHHPDYVTPLPAGHRFPMPKFGKVYDTLIRDGIASLDQFHLPEKAPRSWLEQVHTKEYVDAFFGGSLGAKAMRRIGLPWSDALVNRTRAAVGGTVLAARLALEHGLACSTAGGTHHAFAAFGAGYCILNDLAIAARWVQNQGLARQVMIIDLDVHQGDGTASIFVDDPTVFTFSMHCEANFPLRKQKSDLDLALPIGMEDGAYLSLLCSVLPDLLSQIGPDLVLYDAGVDVHGDDRLGKLSLTDAGIYRRDRTVLEQCIAHGTPTACVVGGGYLRNVDLLARRHCLMHSAASDLFHLQHL